MSDFLHTDIELFHNVCYIVCGVVVERGRVLMVQEAKPSCRGKWYLPAGRMERNESIVVRKSAGSHPAGSHPADSVCTKSGWRFFLLHYCMVSMVMEPSPCLSVCRRL